MRDKMRNLDKLFSKPLPSMRSGAFYNTFPYPTKIFPEAIAVYFASATKPGETVLDAFSGSSGTGIAALLSEHPTEKMIETAKELGVRICRALDCDVSDIMEVIIDSQSRNT